MTSMPAAPTSVAKLDREFRLWAVGIYAFLMAMIVGVGLLLSSCATLGGSPSVTAQKNVFLAENGFAAALKAAVAYENLPTCSAVQHFPCSTPSVVHKVTLSAVAARASLSTAEAVVRSKTTVAAMTAAVSHAQADVTAFEALATELKK